MTHPKYYKYIFDIYQNSYNQNIQSFLEKIDSNINIIYTFSNILSSIYGNEINQTFKNKNFGEFNSYKTEIITVGNYTSDEEIEEKIILYLKSDINNLLIFQFSNEDCILLNYIKNKIDRLLLEKEYENKVFLLIIYLERIFPVPDYLMPHCRLSSLFHLYYIHDLL